MKYIQKWLTGFVIAFALIMGLAIMSPKTVNAASVKLNKKSITLLKGQTQQLKLRGTNRRPVWRTNNRAVASVSDGWVIAKKTGTAKISAVLNGKKYTCKVTVENPKLSKTTLSLKAGKQATLKLKGTSQKITWKSSKPGVASVNQKGRVTAKKKGTAVISAKVNGKKFNCKVTVKKAASPSIPAAPAVDANAVDLVFETEGGGAFVYGLSSAKISFHLDATSGNVSVAVKNAVDEVIYQKIYPICNQDQEISLTWNGKKTNGQFAPSGTYTVVVTSGTIATTSDELIIRDNIFSGGTGSASNPFQVATLEQLKRLGEYNGCYFKQTADISGNEIEQISPQFSETNPFNGTYNGNGFTIRDLTIQSTTEGTALFGAVGENGRLEKVRIENITVMGFGRTAGLVRVNQGTVNECTMVSCNIIQQADSVGGILCDVNDGIIAKCYLENCNLSLSFSPSYLGGLVVDNNKTGRVVDCNMKSCTLTRGGKNGWWTYGYLGGLVRWNQGTMQNCHATDVSLLWNNPDEGSRGGICETNDGIIKNCSFSGTADTLGCSHNNGIIQ